MGMSMMNRKRLINKEIKSKIGTPSTTTYRNKTYNFHSKKSNFSAAFSEVRFLRKEGYNNEYFLKDAIFSQKLIVSGVKLYEINMLPVAVLNKKNKNKIYAELYYVEKSNLENLAKSISTLKSVTEITLIPYHKLGSSKYKELGLDCKYKSDSTYTKRSSSIWNKIPQK